MENERTNAVIYLRVPSGEDPNGEWDLTSQRKACCSHCDEKGYYLVCVVIEEECPEETIERSGFAEIEYRFSDGEEIGIIVVAGKEVLSLYKDTRDEIHKRFSATADIDVEYVNTLSLDIKKPIEAFTKIAPTYKEGDEILTLGENPISFDELFLMGGD